MQPGALRALEFDRIVEAVKAFALTPMGSERLGHLQPSIDPRSVADLLAHTTEAARFLAANGSLPLGASDDLPQILAALAVEGRALEALGSHRREREVLDGLDDAIEFEGPQSAWLHR